MKIDKDFLKYQYIFMIRYAFEQVAMKHNIDYYFLSEFEILEELKKVDSKYLEPLTEFVVAYYKWYKYQLKYANKNLDIRPSEKYSKLTTRKNETKINLVDALKT